MPQIVSEIGALDFRYSCFFWRRFVWKGLFYSGVSKPRARSQKGREWRLRVRKRITEAVGWVIPFVLFFVITLAVNLILRWGFYVINSYRLFYEIYDFYYIGDILVRIHLVGGVVPSATSLAIVFLGFLYKKRDFLIRFSALFVCFTCISTITTGFYSVGMGRVLIVSWLATYLIILIGFFLYRKHPNRLLLAPATYSSMALGHLSSDFLLLPSYIQWCKLRSTGIYPTIGGGGYLDGIFIDSLSGLFSSLVIMIIWKKIEEEAALCC